MKKKTKSLFSLLLWVSVLFLWGFLIYSIPGCTKNSSKYKKPVSVDTPPLLSLPRDQWPEHGLNAVKRHLAWGQCEVCGFPVTTEDVRYGFGKSVGFMDRVYWETFVCYRHVNRVLSSQ